MPDLRIGIHADTDMRHYEFARRYPLGLSRERGLWQWLDEHQDAIVYVVSVVLGTVGIVVANL